MAHKMKAKLYYFFWRTKGKDGVSVYADKKKAEESNMGLKLSDTKGKVTRIFSRPAYATYLPRSRKKNK